MSFETITHYPKAQVKLRLPSQTHQHFFLTYLCNCLCFTQLHLYGHPQLLCTTSNHFLPHLRKRIRIQIHS